MHSTGRKTVCVIANPQAGKIRRSRATVRRLARAVQDQGQLFVPLGLDELERCAAEIAVMRPETVAIAGGDGTVMRVLSSLLRLYREAELPKLLLLPFGTVNTTIRRMVGSAAPWSLLDQFLADRGAYRRQPCLRVDIDEVAHLAATLGTGLVSHFFDEYMSVASRGMTTALGVFAKVFFGSFVGHDYAKRILAPVEGKLSIEGRATELSAFTLLVCSVFENVGLGLRPTYRATEAPGKVHLVATDLAARRLGPQAWRVLLGKPLLAPNLVDELLRDFQLEFAVPTPMVLDGERLRARKVTVRTGRCLLVFHPR
jgi:diacylglycerol kinase family enzyme